MENKKIDSIIHDLVKHGQSFNSYHQLLLNPQINLNRKKVCEIMGKCSKHCLEIRNLLLQEEVQQ